MSLSVHDVRYIASLARLRFSEEEEQKLAEQMSEILAYVEKLNELDTTSVPPMSHVLDLNNVVRGDQVQTRVSREEALRNAPDSDGVYFRAPKVIE
ncbi:MAG: Asp-tRNA(Asn)/Glu-tRNA(Gln) amidotransferase subunit GatC [Rhodothermales bacterium]